tara:strand:- start:409 stop:879 length:471 start_codon:yes stop_codon:yes gene_type:complete
MEASLIGKALNFGFSEYRFESYASNFINTILPYVYLLNQLKFAVAKKNYFFTIRASVKMKPLLILFYKLNIIRRFTFKSSSLCYVFPNYTRTNKPIRYIKNYYRSVNPIFLKKHSLLLMRRSLGAATMVLETSYGVITHQNALTLGVGGILVFIIF